MKYKAVSELCGKGCGRRRRPGQRICRECHTEEMSTFRKRQQDPVEALKATMTRVAMGRRRKELPAEFKARLEALAFEVARQIEQFNRPYFESLKKAPAADLAAMVSEQKVA